ncbi:MAG: hypothetical protein ACI4M3_04300 [Acutalibacteraceae bacterium]
MDKKQLKIPGYIWGIAFVLVLCIIYLIVVQIPFMQAKPGLDAEHASAQSQIAIYEEYTNNASTYQAKINKMMAEYQEKSAILFINATKTRDEIYTMIDNFKYQPSSISVSEGQLDSQGRTSSSGEPLYTTTVVLTMQISSSMLLETLDYYEGNLGDKSAEGSYYISSVSLRQVTEGEDAKIVKDQYTVTIQMDLFYFDPQAANSVVSMESTSSAA